ncbi:hypothetical protein [Pseudonocardia parietis]|uniref:Ribosome-associated protein n=1 Tax=Pseudonocardia parietis TaxID=570936 RepID=A0ABS4W1V2_9PSEU|nr:hypothetical protein [Pseudonocardia parietis]MBP2370190.1 hypothetical protein [Pseudonocardia parietis]
MTTLRERIGNAGIDLGRAEPMVRDGWYRVDGEVVTDLDAETAEGSRVNVVPPPVTEHGA